MLLSMPEVFIRPATKNDTTGLRNLIPTIQQQEFDLPITWEQQPDLHDIDGFYRKGIGEFWVAEHNNDIIGSIALIDIGSQQAVIRKMFVQKEWRGKPYSIAQKLFDHLLDYAKSMGVRTLLLGTTAKFLAAHRFYERNQFQEILMDDLPPAFPLMKVDTRFYCLNLISDQG